MYQTLKHSIENETEISVTKACSSLGVSDSGYQYWLNQKPKKKTWVEEKIVKTAEKNTTCGYRVIKELLNRKQIIVNHKKVLKIMNKHGLTRKKKKYKVITTDSNHGLPVYPNLIKTLVVTGLNQLWTTDITYVHLARETVYLSVVFDRFSRKCIGWSLSRNIDTDLVITSLKMALRKRKKLGLTGLIHHSDQGVQYASNQYTELLEKNGIKISMSRKGNPYDNAHTESAIKTIKYEEVYLNEYETFEDAYKNLKKFLEVVYNKKRLHSSIGYLTPDEFEKQSILKKVSR